MATSTPHDTLAKQFLSDTTVATDFLKSYLPAHIMARCDFNSLRIEPTTYIDEKLRHLTTDILYSLKIDSQLGFIYCLVEHQSTADELMAFRFWSYTTAILRQYADNNESNNKKLPVVIPLLFYTGVKSPYPFSLDLVDCFADTALAKEVMTKPIKLVDLSVIPDEEIQNHGSVALLEMVMKHIHDREMLNQAYTLATLLRQIKLSRNLVLNMLKYVISQGESHDVDAFLKVIEDTPYRSEAMTMAEQLTQRGIQQGMQQGKLEGLLLTAQNMLLKGFDLHTIQEITGLSETDLLK